MSHENDDDDNNNNRFVVKINNIASTVIAFDFAERKVSFKPRSFLFLRAVRPEAFPQRVFMLTPGNTDWGYTV